MSSLRNLFLDDGGTDCSTIEVEFEGDAKFTLNDTTKTTATPEITDANRLKSFITYKLASLQHFKQSLLITKSTAFLQ
ncbi:MAG: hypothetical protein L3J06_08135 [Cyclobacteriaceae bacterium]|nr:hypothetical protein [Cyclobacteriaceae bacterium]